MEGNVGKIVFAVAVATLLIIVGTLSFLYIKDGQLAYSGTGDSTPDAGTNPPPTSANLAPDFTYYAVNGGVVSLSGLKGSVVILDFMATWCQPCKDQITNLKAIQSEYAGQNVVIISLNVDLQVTNSELLAYRNQQGATWDFVTDSNGISMNPKYSVSSIPTIVIINREGEIAKRTVGLMSTSALRTAINPLL
jgi:thiol-disulfide isomerase/thioredoxin